MCQSNLDFAINHRWRFILPVDPGSECGCAFMPLPPVDLFPNHMDHGQHSKNDHEDFER
jgi:hypothetical protein